MKPFPLNHHPHNQLRLSELSSVINFLNKEFVFFSNSLIIKTEEDDEGKSWITFLDPITNETIYKIHTGCSESCTLG